MPADSLQMQKFKPHKSCTVTKPNQGGTQATNVNKSNSMPPPASLPSHLQLLQLAECFQAAQAVQAARVCAREPQAEQVLQACYSPENSSVDMLAVADVKRCELHVAGDEAKRIG
jgi:hypothetical protein